MEKEKEQEILERVFSIWSNKNSCTKIGNCTYGYHVSTDRVKRELSTIMDFKHEDIVLLLFENGYDFTTTEEGVFWKVYLPE